MGLRVGVTEKTARLFMHKVREIMKSSENFLIDGLVYLYEFLVGKQEQGKMGKSYHTSSKKAVTAAQLTKEDKVIRMYI